MARRDALTHDMFAMPVPATSAPGSMDFRPAIADLVKTMLDGHDRATVACRCSELTGKDVSKYMLDSYTAPSKADFNAPAYLMPALEVATESYVYSNWLASVRGGRFFIGREALAAELGRVKGEQDKLRQIERLLQNELRRSV
ncbi:hypothetical protein L2Y94_06475 [Luteibacter aegosomatis]|uniref:hypothetical protein n=1 Tax=Luteibacter aegosomatis TaxID=2911537 RepID=UPI001FF90BD5|nr:hypothetical protein [Luteibacter aegosomatis]UPG86996.1 hypothetical protein L2Y94_06475 [Luteibacter aegosomatis]